MRHGLRRATAAGVCALGLTACGGSETSAPLAKQSIADQSKVLKRELVSERDISAVGAGSPERAFLEYWSDVQYGNLRRALLAFHPELVDQITAGSMTAALRNALPFYRASKPVIERVIREGEDVTLHYYAATQSSGAAAAPLSTTLRRIDGEWRIVYSSALDDELKIVAQAQEQARIRPGAQQLDPRAIAAGERAAGLQAAFMEKLDDPQRRR